MKQWFINRMEVAATAGSCGYWTCLAIVSAVLLGFQLASYRYGHGHPTQLVFNTALFLLSVFYLVSQRLLRIVLFISSITLLISAMLMIVLNYPQWR